MVREFFSSLFSRLFSKKTKTTTDVAQTISPEEEANRYALEILALEADELFLAAQIREKQSKIALLEPSTNVQPSSAGLFSSFKKSPKQQNPNLLALVELHNDIAALSRQLTQINKKLAKKKNAFYEFFCEFSTAQSIGFQGEKLNSESKILIEQITKNKKLDSNIFYEVSLDENNTSNDAKNISIPKKPEQTPRIERKNISLKKIPRPEKSIWLRLAGIFHRKAKDVDQTPNILSRHVKHF